MVALLYVGMGNLPPQLQAQLPSVQPVAQPTSTPLFNAQEVLTRVSQAVHVSAERLELADQFSKELVLSGHSLSRNLVLDRERGGQLLYEVIVDTETGRMLGGLEMEALWEAERAVYRTRYGDHALECVARREGVAIGNLQLANDLLESYPLTGVIFWQVKVTDVEGEAIYGVALNAEGEEVDAEALKRAEFEASKAQYGRLEPALYYFLQTRNPGDKVPVLIWVKGVDYRWVDTQLAERYPKLAAEYRFAGGHGVHENGSLVHLEPELFERVHTDYNDLLDQAHLDAAQPVVDFLKARGHEPQPFELFPGVYAKLPKSAVLELNEASLEGLGTIYWGAVEVHSALDSTASTIRASEVWDSDLCDWHGCIGAGVTIAIVEGGIIRTDVSHGALQGKIVAANVDESTSQHAAAVAGVIVGDHPDFPQYRGIAYGSRSLVSARVLDGSYEYFESGLNWAVDQGAFVVNASFSTTGTLKMRPEDRILDYLVRQRDPTVVIAAGNDTGDIWGVNIKSPAHAYNVITVGAFDDRNDANWSNDEMLIDSCYVDPYIDGQDITGDREKPEVVAVGNVTTVDTDLGNDGFRVQGGTSFAAPQVTGLAALLIERYWDIRANPEAIKAIIMASAVNNIEGGARLSDKDGAGGIDVSYALSVFQNGGWCYHNISDIMNFDALDNPFDDIKTSYDFHAGDGFWDVGGTWANAGERVRAVLAWDSNPSVDFQTDGSDPLSTDFDMYIVSPSGDMVASSDSVRNNYEIVDFIANETGEYKMRVNLFNTSGESPRLGLGLAWVRVPEYDATYPDHDTPGAMEVGSAHWVHLTARNSGRLDWPVSGDPRISVGYRWYHGGDLVLENPDAASIGADLPFGDSATRSVYLLAPTTPGNYQLKWDMVLWEDGGYTWFEDLDDEPVYEPLSLFVAVQDTTPPDNPTNVESSSHAVAEWSNDDAITVYWSGASDPGSGVYGYSVLWDTSASALPDTTVDTRNESFTTALDDGASHYFHVRTRDNAENWAAGAVHLGPFYVDTTAPAADVGALPSYVTTLSFDVSWQAFDPPPAAGLESYDVQYKDGAGPWTDWLTDIPSSQTTASFVGENHHTYSFRCRARDVLGNEGDWSDPVQTEVRTTPYLVVSPLSLLYLIDVDEPGLYTCAVTVKNEGGGTLHWSVVKDQPWLEVTPSGGDGQATLSVVVDSSALLTGAYAAQVAVSGAEGTWWSPQTVDVTVLVVEEVSRVYFPLIMKNHPPLASLATIVLDAPQPDGDNGWYVSDVEVSFTVPSGMVMPRIEYRLNLGDWHPFTTPFTVTTEGESLVQIRPAQVVDGPFDWEARRVRLAGSADEEILSFVVKIDKSPPALVVATPQPIAYTRGATFTLDYRAADPYSGLAAITATLDTQPVTNGRVIDTLALGYGAHEFGLAARDGAGRVASRTVTFSVTTTLSGLIDLKHRLYAEGGIYGPGAHGIVQSLDAKLEAAQRKLETGQLHVAINNLQAFIHEVEAQTGKHITPDAAELMIEDAQRIIASLSGQMSRLRE